MNRRSFLSDFLKGAGTVMVAPQIVTHGLHLIRPRIVPVELYRVQAQALNRKVPILYVHFTISENVEVGSFIGITDYFQNYSLRGDYEVLKVKKL